MKTEKRTQQQNAKIVSIKCEERAINANCESFMYSLCSLIDALSSVVFSFNISSFLNRLLDVKKEDNEKRKMKTMEIEFLSSLLQKEYFQSK